MVLRRRLLVSPWGGVLDLSEKIMDSGSGLEHRSDVEVPTHLSDPLTNASYVWTVGGFSSSLSQCAPPGLGCRDRTDGEVRITIPHKSMHEVVQVLSLLHNAPGTIAKTPYRTPFNMCWMVRRKVQILVRVHLFTVYSNFEFIILLPLYQGRGETHSPPPPW